MFLGLLQTFWKPIAGIAVVLALILYMQSLRAAVHARDEKIAQQVLELNDVAAQRDAIAARARENEATLKSAIAKQNADIEEKQNLLKAVQASVGSARQQNAELTKKSDALIAAAKKETQPKTCKAAMAYLVQKGRALQWSN